MSRTGSLGRARRAATPSFVRRGRAAHAPAAPESGNPSRPARRTLPRPRGSRPGRHAARQRSLAGRRRRPPTPKDTRRRKRRQRRRWQRWRWRSAGPPALALIDARLPTRITLRCAMPAAATARLAAVLLAVPWAAPVSRMQCRGGCTRCRQAERPRRYFGLWWRQSQSSAPWDERPAQEARSRPRHCCRRRAFFLAGGGVTADVSQ